MPDGGPATAKCKSRRLARDHALLEAGERIRFASPVLLKVGVITTSDVQNADSGSGNAKITVGVGEIDPHGTNSPVNTGIRSARLAFGFPAI